MRRSIAGKFTESYCKWKLNHVLRRTVRIRSRYNQQNAHRWHAIRMREYFQNQNSITNFSYSVDDQSEFLQEDYKFSVNDTNATAAIADEIENDDKNQSNFPLEEELKGSEHKQDSIAIRTKRKRHACNQCDKSYAKSSTLKRHQRSVHQGHSFICDICEKSFATKDQAKNHKIAVHDALRPYDCKQCGRAFSDRSNLRRHKMNIHQGIEAYVCDICDKRFSAKYALKCHLRTHTGEKLYSCDICKKDFAAKDSLQNHKKAVHHGIRSHECKQCDRTFAYMPALRLHEKIVHQRAPPLVCEICDKRFSVKSSLKKHMRKHI